jgi:hypothetical protein
VSAANVNPESGAINTGSASMASSAMVPTTAPALHRHPSALSDVPSTSDEGQSITPTNQSTTGWVETISQHIKQQTFQKQLETYCWQHGEKTPQAPILQPGIGGLAGVIKGKSIPFQHI